MKDAFISYSRKNKEFIQLFAAAFENAGRALWVDWEGIPHGSEWWKEIETGIEDANTFIFVISPDSIASEVCVRELEHAVKNNKRLIPVLYQEVKGKIPEALAKLNWVFFRETDEFKQSFNALLDTIDTDLDAVKMHTRLLTRAAEWDKHGHDSSFLLRGNDLRSAEQWLGACSCDTTPKPTSLHTQYIINSSRSESKGQRLKLLIVAIGLAITVVLGLFANYQRNLANKARQSAERQEKRAIANEAEALSLLSAARQVTDDQLGSLLAGVKSAKKLQRIVSFKDDETLVNQLKVLNKQVPDTLREAINRTQEHNRLEWHENKVRAITFSPDSKLIASASSDYTVKIWKRDGTRLHTLQHDGAVTGVTFGPEGKILASGSKDRKVRLWDVKGNLLHTFKHTAKVFDVSISPDGQLIAAGYADGTVYLWLRNGQVRHVLQGHSATVEALAFSPDGQTLASAGFDRIINLWRVQDGKLQTTLRGHKDRVDAVNFRPDGQKLASAGADNTVRLWRTDGSTEPERTLEAHKNWVLDVKYSSDGNTLASASANGTVKLWSHDGTLLKIFKNPGTRVMSITFSPDSKVLASASADSRIRLYNLQAGTSVKILEGHTSGLKDLDFSFDGRLIASTGTDATIRLWDNQTHRLKNTIDTVSSIRDVDFVPMPAGKPPLLAAATYDNTIQFRRLDGTLVKTLKEENKKVKSLAVNPDGKLLASASTNEIQLWTMEGKRLMRLSGHTGAVNAVSFSHDGTLLASGSADYNAILWHRDGRLLHLLKGHQGWVNNLSFSPDDKYLATASSDLTVKLWHIADGSLVKTMEGHTDWVWDVHFYPNPNKKVLASAGSDNTIRIWNYPQGNLLATLKQHDSWVRAVSFSPDGKEIASAGADQKVILWDLQSLQERLIAKDSQGLEKLLAKGCALLRDYLKTSTKLSEQDKQVCGSEIGLWTN
ncbi:MAG: TIR domain-containing protein [Gammaproteobacteria bacterium]|nr:TIR domain-containing protein [Gammaproteobacteria bacterium]